MRWTWLIKGSAIYCVLDIGTKIKLSDSFSKNHKLINEIASFISIETLLLKIIVPLAWQKQWSFERLQVCQQLFSQVCSLLCTPLAIRFALLFHVIVILLLSLLQVTPPHTPFPFKGILLHPKGPNVRCTGQKFLTWFSAEYFFCP